MVFWSFKCKKKKGSKKRGRKKRSKRKYASKRKYGSKRRYSSKKRVGSKRRFSRRRYGSKRRFGSKRKFSRRRYGSKRRFSRSRFGKGGQFPGLNRIMGNYSPAEMNTFQQYTGMGDSQRKTHLSKVPKNIRMNYYSDIN